MPIHRETYSATSACPGDPHTVACFDIQAGKMFLLPHALMFYHQVGSGFVHTSRTTAWEGMAEAARCSFSGVMRLTSGNISSFFD